MTDRAEMGERAPHALLRSASVRAIRGVATPILGQHDLLVTGPDDTEDRFGHRLRRMSLDRPRITAYLSACGQRLTIEPSIADIRTPSVVFETAT